MTNPKQLESLVTSLELSKRLFEAGVTKDIQSLFHWEQFGPGKLAKWMVCDYDESCHLSELLQTPYFPALTFEELLQVLPPFIEDNDFLSISKTVDGKYIAEYGYGRASNYVKFTPIEALSALTTWLLDNDHLPLTS